MSAKVFVSLKWKSSLLKSKRISFFGLIFRLQKRNTLKVIKGKRRKELNFSFKNFVKNVAHCFECMWNVLNIKEIWQFSYSALFFTNF